MNKNNVAFEKMQRNLPLVESDIRNLLMNIMSRLEIIENKLNEDQTRRSTADSTGNQRRGRSRKEESEGTRGSTEDA